MAAAQPRGGNAVLLPVVQGRLEAEAHTTSEEERGAAHRFSDVYSLYIITDTSILFQLLS